MTLNSLRLLDIHTAPQQLSLHYALDGLHFNNTLWYEGIDFVALAERHGAAMIRRILFHIAAFEINKLASLMPRRVDWGPFQDLVTPEFEALWRQVFSQVWAQWRYENQQPHYHGPSMVCTASSTPHPIQRKLEQARLLSFCGGGKDSLVALHLLQQLEQSYSSLAYSASFYGPAPFQHRLIGQLLDAFQAQSQTQRQTQGQTGLQQQHRQWIFDDFLDSPVCQLNPQWNIQTLTAAETPSSIFAALPYVLAHGYRYVCLAHERSADAAQLHWQETGEAINHQWGKSYAAEQLLNNYIQQHLIADFDYFSVLKPINDVAIFGLLRDVEPLAPLTHSCNVAKPWCRRCAKCLYVWLGYSAFLSPEIVRQTFGDENLFDVDENMFLFRQLLGLEEQLPFECIGEAPEAALYMSMAWAQGYRGRAFDECAEAWQGLDVKAVLDRYLAVHWQDANIPPALQALKGLLEQHTAQTRDWIQALLKLP